MYIIIAHTLIHVWQGASYTSSHSMCGFWWTSKECEVRTVKLAITACGVICCYHYSTNNLTGAARWFSLGDRALFISMVIEHLSSPWKAVTMLMLVCVVLLLILSCFEGRQVAVLKDSKQYVQGVCWDPQGKVVVTLSNDRYDVITSSVWMRVGKPSLGSWIESLYYRS